jgi:hypothetical protein
MAARNNGLHFRHFADAFFELIGYQALHFIRRGTGQNGDNDGCADRKFRIFESRHRQKMTHTQDDDQRNEQGKGAIVADAPLGCVHRVFSSIKDTCWPSRNR